jgi:hypothetical protein
VDSRRLFVKGQFRLFVPNFLEYPPAKINFSILEILLGTGFIRFGDSYPFMGYKYATSTYYYNFAANCSKKGSVRGRVKAFFGLSSKEEVESKVAEQDFSRLRYGLPFCVHVKLVPKKRVKDGKNYYLLEIQSDSVAYIKFKKGFCGELPEEKLVALFEENEKLVLKIGGGLAAEAVGSVKDGRNLDSADKDPLFLEWFELLGPRFEKELDGLSLVYGKSEICCAFLLRKIIEKATIISFLRRKVGEKIIDPESKKKDYFGLNRLLDLAVEEKSSGFPLLTKGVRDKLCSIKFLGDVSAHDILVDGLSPELIERSLTPIDVALRELSNKEAE